MSEQQPIKWEVKVVVCLIATRRYKIFVQPLVDSICKFFLNPFKIEIHLFTDELEVEYFGNERVQIIKELIPSYGFPQATLLRYEIMTSKKYNCDYLYYLDVDYLIVSEVEAEDLFANLVAVLHPGFAMVGGGSWCDDKKSNAYTFPENREHYFAGGTQGGMYEIYYRAMQQMNMFILNDEKRGVKAEWNDEAHWNKLLSERRSFKILDPSFCMVEQMYLRQVWKIDHLQPKIIALEKNHKLFQGE